MKPYFIPLCSLSSCNREGYRRFTTFHEHNIGNALRRIANSDGFPYFLEQKILYTMEKVFSFHKDNHVSSKAKFSHEVW